MPDKDFETDRGTGGIITAFAILAIAAIAALYMLFPVDKDAAGKDTPQATLSQPATDGRATGSSR